MLYRIAADGLVLFHLAFIVFVMFGGVLLLNVLVYRQVIKQWSA
jgi:hypothetical protein